MPYPCEKLSAWWVVYRVNPREWLHTPDDFGYRENHMVAGEVDEIYQDDELSCSFNIDPDSTLNSLLDDVNDVTFPEQRKQALRKKETQDIEHSLYFILCSLYFILYSLYFILHSCYDLLHSLYFFHTMFLINTHLRLF
jgi:hypothetical protein